MFPRAPRNAIDKAFLAHGLSHPDDRPGGHDGIRDGGHGRPQANPASIGESSLPQLVANPSLDDLFVSGAEPLGVEQHEVATRAALDPYRKRQVTPLLS
jgi:hypothetical protein